ncbi:retinol dehydrogenase 16-like [Odocoileus virginianus]|uniref:Retinol dehydrogenase 16-like n=1 Tax=Odocoileus virginianus TaxID=9874 RepID=A0ABM4H5M5_ODOVR
MTCRKCLQREGQVSAMWLHLAVLGGLFYLLRWYRERQVLSHLRDKFVFITGCDSGFGNLLARQLDLRDLRVLAGCLTEQGAEQLRNQTSGRLQTVILDVTKAESIAAATEWMKERVGDRGLWGLVNNAGILLSAAPNEWLTKDDFSKILNVNLIGLIEVTLSLLPLIRRTRGRVVRVSSPAGSVSVWRWLLHFLEILIWGRSFFRQSEKGAQSFWHSCCSHSTWKVQNIHFP